MELSDRQKFILTLVVHDYIRSAVPVGSKNLVEHYRLEMSPATVRNEMGVLTDLGYLRQPHTSAGRVPTEEGYRYFVGRLLRQTDLPDSTRHMIDRQETLYIRKMQISSAIDCPHSTHTNHVLNKISSPQGDVLL